MEEEHRHAERQHRRKERELEREKKREDRRRKQWEEYEKCIEVAVENEENLDDVCEKPAFHSHPTHHTRRHHRRSHSLDAEWGDEDEQYYDELDGDDEGYITDEYDFSAPFNG